MFIFLVPSYKLTKSVQYMGPDLSCQPTVDATPSMGSDGKQPDSGEEMASSKVVLSI